MPSLIPDHLLPYGTGYNASVKGSVKFCSAPSFLQALPQFRNALYAPIDFDNISLTAYGTVWRQFQKRGTCVGQSVKNAADIRNAALFLLFPHLKRHVTTPAGTLARFSVCATYAAGRVEVANQRGTWDGAAVSWVMEAATRIGNLPRFILNLPETHSTSYPQERSLEPDEQWAVEWAADRSGVPDNLEAQMKQYAFESSPPVRSLPELAMCLTNGIPVPQGSDLIPVDRPDSSGLCDVSSGGGHATLFGGIRAPGDTTCTRPLPAPDQCEYKYINSWGFDWGVKGAAWIRARHAKAMLDQNDAFAAY